MIDNKQVSPCFFGVSKEPNTYQVSFEITNYCNLKCRHCCNDSSISKGCYLSKEEMFNLIDELKSINTTSIYVTGGEPTLHPDFLDIAKHINNNGMTLVLATNGYDIHNQLEIIKENVSHPAGVFVSLDGIGVVHDEFRGVSGAFLNAVSSIKMLLENNIPVRVSSMVWNKNLDQLEEIIKFVKSLGVYHIHFSTLFKTGRAAESDIFISDEKYREVVDELHTLIEKYSDENFSVSTRRDQRLDSSSERCHGGEKILHINSRGQIFPCSWAEKCAPDAKYGHQWQSGNIKECLTAVGRFQELVDKRIECLGYSGCPAMAISLSDEELADDPINNILKD